MPLERVGGHLRIQWVGLGDCAPSCSPWSSAHPIGQHRQGEGSLELASLTPEMPPEACGPDRLQTQPSRLGHSVNFTVKIIALLAAFACGN